MIKNILLKIYFFLSQFMRQQRWRMESIVERKKLAANPNIIQNFDGKMLILIPHVDDEWMCSSSLLLNNSKKVLLCDMDMPGGDTEELHHARKEELKNVSEYTGKEVVSVTTNKVESLRLIIESYSPDYIFVPFFIDWHDDHIEVMHILNDALNMIQLDKNNIKIAGYQVSTPIAHQFITHAIPLTKRDWKRKRHLFYQFYHSQKHLSYIRFALQEYINGALLNAYASEVFSVFSIKEWQEYLLVMIPNNCMRENYKRELMSISKMRQLVQKNIKRIIK